MEAIILVGDKESDIEIGTKAEIPVNILTGSKNMKNNNMKVTIIINSLMDLILEKGCEEWKLELT